jgi:hypothetical protein
MTCRILCAASFVLLAGNAAGQVAEKRSLVEAIMARAFMERGGFLSCATKDKYAEAIAFVKRIWKLDVEDMAKQLRESGYAADYVAALAARYDNLESATPKFTDQDSWEKFCTLVGDWKHRTNLLLFTVPALEYRIKTK